MTRRKHDGEFTVARFAELMGVHRHEFMKRLEAASPKQVGTSSQGAPIYRVKDLVNVLLGGDHEAEKLRKTREEADRLAIANARARGELVEIAAVKKLGEKFMVALRQRILAMPLTDEEKDRCLGEIVGLKTVDWNTGS